MSAVWVVRPPVMAMQWPIQYHGSESTAQMALQMHHNVGVDSTITRETLLTPEMSAVLEAAKALVLSEGDSDTMFCSYTELLALQSAVATLRGQEGA